MMEQDLVRRSPLEGFAMCGCRSGGVDRFLLTRVKRSGQCIAVERRRGQTVLRS